MPGPIVRTGLLEVFLLGRKTGELRYTSHRNEMHFQYDEAYLADSDAIPLSHALPLRKEPFDSDERSQCHQFWDSLLGEVLGVTDLKRFIEYEKPVYFNDGTTKSLDAWIPSSRGPQRTWLAHVPRLECGLGL